ncbi:MAG: hypothetical protein ACE5DN_00650, partial [Flavobacteriales bacterium]
MAARPEPDYNCTQLELYAVCRIGLSSYREQLADFTNFKGFYDAAWGNDFEAAIEAAAALPDFQARDEPSETANTFLGKKGKQCTNKWQDLKRYITTTTGWEEVQKPKLEAAGSTLYQKASHENWEVLKGLMITASNFIDNNEAALEADQNMPNAFKGQFNTLKDEYIALYDEFTDAEQDSKGGTDEKINANNAINKTCNIMFGDGQAIYRDNPALKDRFIFDTVLKLVRGSKGKTKTIDIAPSSREFVERVVKNSEIKNTGQVQLLLEVGNVEAPTPSAITIPVDGS